MSIFAFSSLCDNGGLPSNSPFPVLAKYKVFSPKSPFVRRINNKYRINVLVKAKLNKEVYSQIYEKINIFNKNKNKLLNFVVTKNPTSIS